MSPFRSLRPHLPDGRISACGLLRRQNRLLLRQNSLIHNRACERKSAPKGAQVAIPWPPRNSYRCSIESMVPCNGTPHFLFACPLFVRNLAVQVMQGKSPGDRPRAMGIFKGSSELGRRRFLRAREALHLRSGPAPVEQPHRYHSIWISQLHHQYHARKSIVWGGRDD